MGKPSLANLEVIDLSRQGREQPIATSIVRGEDAIVKAAAELGWTDHARDAAACVRRSRGGAPES
jgi:delta-aminolevulinic acid dehydratase/porphobilinogen synthase